jgi:hypothetical protein
MSGAENASDIPEISRFIVFVERIRLADPALPGAARRFDRYRVPFAVDITIMGTRSWVMSHLSQCLL